jgi:multidrug efflux pump subunit AcrA (membrane-fusion protein)
MAHTDTDDIQATLGLTAESRHRARRSRWLWIAIVVLVVAGGLWAWWHTRGDAGPQYQTSPVARRTLTVSVTATGALDALTQVDIGTEISGIIESVDVDFNSPVHVGQILARVNTEKLDAQAAQARASLNASKAKQVQAQATLVEAQADLARFQHVRELSGGKVPSQQDMDAQVATVKRDEADQHSADAGVAQSQANLDAIETTKPSSARPSTASSSTAKSIPARRSRRHSRRRRSSRWPKTSPRCGSSSTSTRPTSDRCAPASARRSGSTPIPIARSIRLCRKCAAPRRRRTAS